MKAWNSAPLLALLMSVAIAPHLARAQTHAPGDYLDKGLSLDVSTVLGDRLSDQIASLIPPDMAVPETPVLVDCPLDCSSTLNLKLIGGTVDLNLASASLRTQEGVLWLDTVIESRLQPGASLSLSNGAARTCDPYSPCCGLDACPEGTCSVESDWIPFHYSVGLSFDIQDSDGPGGTPPDYAYTVHGPVYDIQEVMDRAVLTSDCGANPDLQYWMVQSLGAGIGSLISPALLQLAEQDLPGQLSLVGSLWGLLNLDDVLDILGSSIHYSLYVSGVDVTDGGLRLDLDTLLEAPEPAQCIAALDPLGYPATPNPSPAFVQQIPGTPLDYDAGIVLSDDVANQLAYAAWRSGALCAVVDEELVGFPLDSALVGAGLGDSVNAAMEHVLMGEVTPMEVHLLPTQVPEAIITGPHDLSLWLADLEMRFVTEVMGRKTVLFAVQVDLGLDLDIRATAYGEIDVEIGLDSSALNTRLVSNELMPQVGEDLHRAFPDFLLGLLDTAGGAFLGHLYLGPLAFSGVAPVDALSRTRGAGNDYREIFVRMDAPEVGQSEGGIACSSCDLTACTDPNTCGGCDTGRSTTPVVPFAGMALLPLLAFLVLRRS